MPVQMYRCRVGDAIEKCRSRRGASLDVLISGRDQDRDSAGNSKLRYSRQSAVQTKGSWTCAGATVVIICMQAVKASKHWRPETLVMGKSPSCRACRAVQDASVDVPGLASPPALVQWHLQAVPSPASPWPHDPRAPAARTATLAFYSSHHALTAHHLGCFVPTFLFSKTSRIWPLVQSPQGLPLTRASWFLRALPSLWLPPHETTSHSLPSPVILHHKPQLQRYLTSSSRLALQLIVQGFTSSALAFLAHPLIHTWRATCPAMTTAGNVSQSHSPAWKDLDSTPQATAASWIP